MARPCFDPSAGPMPIVGATIFPTQAERLARVATAAGTSRSAVVREALDAYFRQLDEVTAPAHEAARTAAENLQAQVDRASAIGRAANQLFAEEATRAS